MSPSRVMAHQRSATTILVVDDEPSIHGFLTDFLQEKGYRVESAASAQDAITLVQRSTVDAIVLDVKMPGRSGLDVLEHVRFDPIHRDVPVLLLTGAALTPEEEAIVTSLRAYVFYKQEDFTEFSAYIDRLTQQPV